MIKTRSGRAGPSAWQASSPTENEKANASAERAHRLATTGARPATTAFGENREGFAAADDSCMGQGIAKKTCDVLAMLTSIHSAVVDVRDFELAIRDYTRLLGQAPVRIESNTARGKRSALFGLANILLELRADEGVFETGEGHETAGRRFGQAGIRLVCEDDDPSAVLAARGVLVSSSQEEGVCEGGLGVRRWWSHQLDPKSSRGLPIELISRETLEPPEKWTEGASSIDPASRVRGLDHVVVLSPDPEATLAFYRDGLGIRLALDKTFEDRGVRLIFFRLGGTTIEIGARLGTQARPDRSDRFGGLAWQVVGIEAIRARLAADGFDVSAIRDGNKLGTRVCTVREPVHDVPTLLIEPVS